MAAIFYHPDAYEVHGPKLMGRVAAGASFLAGLLRHCTNSDLCVYGSDQSFAQAVANLARAKGASANIKFLSSESPELLKDQQVLHFPAPAIGDLAAMRAVYGDNAWSLTGIAHTTASSSAIQDITSLVWNPVRSWDALICPSNAVKEHITNLIDVQRDYVSERFGGKVTEFPQLPVIPIGIETDRFSFTDLEKATARNNLNLPSDAIVILYVGRLSFHAKAHPFPFYAAVQEASEKTKRNIHVVECGWHHNEFIKDAFLEAQQALAPSVKFHSLDGRIESNLNTAWACADIFCSFSDNIQETFGITPLEAMASGLPIVASAWNGYRESVRHETDGFLVSTACPEAGEGAIFSNSYLLEKLNYDQYCGYTSSTVSISLPEATAAFTALVESEALRGDMGGAGRERARAVYDWQNIIPQYEALWSELTEIRTSASSTLKVSLPPMPNRLEPFSAFGHYSTHKITEKSELFAAFDTVDLFLKRYKLIINLKSVSFFETLIPSEELVVRYFEELQGNSKSVGLLLKNIGRQNNTLGLIEVSWMIKFGLLRLAE